MVTKHRRHRYDDEEEDHARPSSSFTWGNVTNLLAIPILSGIVMLVGFYFVTGDTLKRHDGDIAIIKVESKVEREAVLAKTEEDRKAREKIRDEFLASTQKTTEGIARLDTRLAVSENEQKMMNVQLGKIVDSLQRISGGGMVPSSPRSP